MVHASHPAIVKRLKRAQGHLASVIKMIEDGRSCEELAQQLFAVESAVTNAKRELIHDHIDHCLGDGSPSDQPIVGAFAELKAITKYL